MTTATAPAYTYRHSGLRSARFQPENAVLVVDDWMVFTDTSLTRLEVFVDGVNRRTFLNADTWDSFDGPAEVAFEADFITAYAERKVREMRFLVTDAGPYGAAARKQAAAEGTDVVMAKDRLTELCERADSLIIQAASLNKTPSELQLQTFAVRHAMLVDDLHALEAVMDQLRSKVGLAAVALVDASTA